MDFSRGIASRTRSRKWLSLGLSRGTQRNTVMKKDGVGFVDKHINFERDYSSSSSSQDGSQYLGESSGNNHESRTSRGVENKRKACHTRHKAHNSYKLRKRSKVEQTPREVGIEIITEAEFSSIQEHDHDEEAEVKHGSLNRNKFKRRQTKQKPRETGIEKITEDDFRNIQEHNHDGEAAVKPKSLNGNKFKKRKIKQKPQETGIEKISEADFINSRKHDSDEEDLIEIESSTEAHIRIESISEAESENCGARHRHHDTYMELSVSGSAQGENDGEERNEADYNDDGRNEESAPPSEVESDSLFSSSSGSEDDDSDDENFTMAHSQESDSTSTSLFEEESDEHGSDELCSNEEGSVKGKWKISVDASDKGSRDEVEVDVEELGGDRDGELSCNEEGSAKKKSRTSVDASDKGSQDKVEVDFEELGGDRDEDSVKKKSRISVDASVKGSQDKVEVDFEELGGDRDEEGSVKKSSKISVDASVKGSQDEVEANIEKLGGHRDEDSSRDEEGSVKKSSKISVDASDKGSQAEVEVDVEELGGGHDEEPSRNEEDSDKKKSRISADASYKGNQDEVEVEFEVEVEEVGGDSDERTETDHNDLENGVRSKIKDVLLSKTERISKTVEAQDLKASKTRETEDLLVPSETRKKFSKIPQIQRKINFPSTENGKKLCSDESNKNKKRKATPCPIRQGGVSRSNLRKSSELSTREEEDNEDGGWTPRNEHLTKKCASTRKDHSFCEKLLNSVLVDETDDEEAKQFPDHEDTLPLKFRFEDEVPKPVEKSEFEIMTDGLFEEMTLSLMYGDVDFSEQQKEVEKDNDTDSEDGEMTQYERCCKGKHYLIEDDEYNIICKYCLHIEKEARHTIPPWVETMHHGTKKTFPRGNPSSSVLDELDMEQGENPTNSQIPREGTIWDIKPGTKQTMYQHQQEGLEFLWKNLAGSINLADLKKTSKHSKSIGGCIISHAPGTGKTRLTMVFIETFLKLFPRCRPLIIAPASMLLTWEQEFKKWEVEFPFHNLNNLEISDKEDGHNAVMENLSHGNYLTLDTVRHVKIYSWNQKKSILGMSYHLFEILTGKRSRNEGVKRILLEKPGLVVLDEGHTPRNERSSTWNTLLKLKTEKRVILSGTPFQNNFQELFNILTIVRPQIAGDLEKDKTFSEMIKYRRSRENARASDHEIEKLKKVMEQFVHVHKGTILQQSLPGLKDCVVLLDPPPLQKDLIKRLDTLDEVKGTFKFEFKAALISVHPYLFKDCGTTKKEKDGVDLEELEASKLSPTEGVKTRFLMELVRLSALRNEKVLVFSQYIKPLRLINLHLEKTFGWIGGKHILSMEGRMLQKPRQELINSFNDPNSDSKVLLASTKCCSEGINLVGASRVVLLDVVWNPSVERQAISRAYRLGQKKIVYTYHLMTKGTPEWEKFCRQAEKERLSELVFTSSSNENCKITNCDDAGIGDGVLEEMVADVQMKDVFEKIIYQPKEQNLIETFSVAGS